MLSKVIVETIYCSVLKDGEVAACESLIAQAKENGAHHTYLQVVRENATAVNMYLKLGYERVYTYWYMKK